MDRYYVEKEMYKNAEKLATFRKPSRLLNFEGVFLELYHVDIPSFLYFDKIDYNKCCEKTTGKIFYRTDDGNFFNEETGLYFNAGNFIEVPSSEFHEISIENNGEYLKQANYFFNYFIKFKEEDNNKRDKAELLLLKKGIKFRD